MSQVAKRGLLWEWQAATWNSGPLHAFARRWPRSRFYYRSHGFAFTKAGALRAAERSDERQRAWMTRWEMEETG